jgi:hypothetical protein
MSRAARSIEINREGRAMPEGKVVLCQQQRCVPYDETLALKWAASLVGQLNELRPYRELDVQSAPWFKEGAHTVLYVRDDWIKRRPHPKRCTALDFVAGEEGLFVDVTDRGRPAPRFGCRHRLTLDSYVTLFDDGCTYANGDSFGLSDGDELHDDRMLSSVDDSGLVYDGLIVAATPRCAWSSVDRPGCAEATCRTCWIVLEVKGDSGHIFVRTANPKETHSVVQDAGCPPCLQDQQEANLPRVAAILKGRKFLRVLDEPAAFRFFRAKADCEAFLRDTRDDEN